MSFLAQHFQQYAFGYHADVIFKQLKHSALEHELKNLESSLSAEG